MALSQATLDAITAAVVEAITAAVVEATTALRATPAAPLAASTHWWMLDLPCIATPRCEKTFRTVKGQTFHTANVKAK
jgi:hypothetical protein